LTLRSRDGWYPLPLTIVAAATVLVVAGVAGVIWFTRDDGEPTACTLPIPTTETASAATDASGGGTWIYTELDLHHPPIVTGFDIEFHSTHWWNLPTSPHPRTHHHGIPKNRTQRNRTLRRNSHLQRPIPLLPPALLPIRRRYLPRPHRKALSVVDSTDVIICDSLPSRYYW